VTLDSEEAGGWSKLPWYALRRNYFSAIVAAGGCVALRPRRHAEAGAALAGRMRIKYPADPIRLLLQSIVAIRCVIESVGEEHAGAIEVLHVEGGYS
jgi:hypothetical protein